MKTYMVEKCRRVNNLYEIINNYARKGWEVNSVVMGDIATMYVVIFEKDVLSSEKFDENGNITEIEKLKMEIEVLKEMLEEKRK